MEPLYDGCESQCPTQLGSRGECGSAAAVPATRQLKAAARWCLSDTSYKSSGVRPVRFAIGQASEDHFLIVMESKHEIRPAGTGKCTVETGLPFDNPADTKKRGQNTSGTRARPLIYATAKETKKVRDRFTMFETVCHNT